MSETPHDDDALAWQRSVNYDLLHMLAFLVPRGNPIMLERYLGVFYSVLRNSTDNGE